MKNYIILPLILGILLVSGCSQNPKITGSSIFQTCKGTSEQKINCYTNVALQQNNELKCKDIVSFISGSFLEETIDCISLVAEQKQDINVCNQIDEFKISTPNTWEESQWTRLKTECLSKV